MTRIRVATKVKLTNAGGLGAFLFVAAPFIGGFITFARYQSAERALRYGLGSSVTLGEIVLIGLASTAAAMIGLVMVLVGREYEHEVQILKPGEEVPKDQTPLFGGTEAERRNLGLK